MLNFAFELFRLAATAFQDVPAASQGNPPWYEAGRIILTLGSIVLNVIQGGLTAYVVVRMKSAEIWKGESNAHEQRADRLKGELDDERARTLLQERELAEYRIKTDLKPLLEKLEMMFQHSVQFEKQTAEVHTAMITAIQANTATIAGLASSFTEHSAADHRFLEGVMEALTGIESRLNNRAGAV